jgi:ribose/xylose/arabinose/galactoside ABC-type transport system permease subunit
MSKKVLPMNIVMRFSRVLILLVLFGFFAMSTDTFCTWSNIKNIVSQQVPFLMILSIGMTIAIILKGVDLSVGSVLALSSCIAALILQATGNVLLCIISGLVVGSLCGFINGIMIAKIGVSAYIATYTMQWIAKGIAYVLLAGGQVFNLDTDFRSIFIGWVLYASGDCAGNCDCYVVFDECDYLWKKRICYWKQRESCQTCRSSCGERTYNLLHNYRISF